MSHDLSPEQRAELLDDFYAECDEQLAAVRASLAELSGSGAKAEDRKRALETAFRHLHSLKGNSTIVGLRAAEDLAHSAEDYLRALTRGQAVLSESGLDALHRTTSRLEQIIAAHRTEQPTPEIESLRNELRALSPGTAATPQQAPAAATPASSTPLPTDKLAAARERGLSLWTFSFVPSPELDARGINVSSVRARLSAQGEIISATPSIRPDKSVLFDFVVGLREPPGDAAEWQSQGLRFSALEPSSPGSPATIESVPAAADQANTLFVSPSHVVRVDLGRLDDLMRIAGELVIHRSRLEARINDRPLDPSGLKETNLALGRSLKELRVAITRIRLVPLTEIFARMPFVVRDLSRESGKKVQLVTQGQQTEIDKYLVERLKEPLLHLVRNAFSHGIENPGDRVAANKPAEGVIELSARPAGDAVIIDVRDDGRGVDAARILAKAKALGLPLPTEVNDATLLQLLCAPGFSTRDEADRAAGRGVGMAVVRETVRELGGQLTMQSSAGRGVTFTLRLPLTLSILDTLIISVGSHTCAIPKTAVDELLQTDPSEVKNVGHAEIIPYRGGALPVVRLHRLFRDNPEPRSSVSIIVVRSELGSTGLLVDRVLGQREVVLRPMKDPLLAAPGIAGATELGDGRPVLILDPLVISRDARSRAPVHAAN